YITSLFFIYFSVIVRNLLTFPTRRSSDLAHGMWTMGNLAKLFTPYYEDGFIEDYSVRFKGMVFLGDTITLKAVLLEKSENKLYLDRKSTRLNSSHVKSSYAVFCLKKNKKN